MQLAPEPLPLLERLRAVADLWCESTGRSLGALSTLATNQGSFFERLNTSRAGATVATLEKFAAVLVDSANWPGHTVPSEILRFAHDVGISAPSATRSPDSAAQSIGSEGGEGSKIPSTAPSGRSLGAEAACPAPPANAPVPGDLLAPLGDAA